MTTTYRLLVLRSDAAQIPACFLPQNPLLEPSEQQETIEFPLPNAHSVAEAQEEAERFAEQYGIPRPLWLTRITVEHIGIE